MSNNLKHSITGKKAKIPNSKSVSRSLFCITTELIECRRIFGRCDGNFDLNPGSAERRKTVQAALAEIVNKYDLAASENKLHDTMLTAAEQYWRWHAINIDVSAGLGAKSNVNSLESALRRAEVHLRDKQLCNRLEKAASSCPPEILPPPYSKDGLHYHFGTSIFDSVSRAHATINGMLVIVRRAREMDGRTGIPHRRDDIRAAAEPLLTYWTTVAGNSGKLGQRGGEYFKAVRFLYDSLKLIDDTVTERLIIDLKN